MSELKKTILFMSCMVFIGWLIIVMFSTENQPPPIRQTLEEIRSTADAYCRSAAAGNYYEYVACKTGGVTSRQDYRN